MTGRSGQLMPGEGFYSRMSHLLSCSIHQTSKTTGFGRILVLMFNPRKRSNFLGKSWCGCDVIPCTLASPHNPQRKTVNSEYYVEVILKQFLASTTQWSKLAFGKE